MLSMTDEMTAPQSRKSQATSVGIPRVLVHKRNPNSKHAREIMKTNIATSCGIRRQEHCICGGKRGTDVVCMCVCVREEKEKLIIVGNRQKRKCKKRKEATSSIKEDEPSFSIHAIHRCHSASLLAAINQPCSNRLLNFA